MIGERSEELIKRLFSVAKGRLKGDVISLSFEPGQLIQMLTDCAREIGEMRRMIAGPEGFCVCRECGEVFFRKDLKCPVCGTDREVSDGVVAHTSRVDPAKCSRDGN